ncbi:MAG TPA: RnfABCDGE type electron transport complex subunit G [Bacteroidales bacterium]|jgi:Na+-translocating ferredoxin:NAD+ oxidoreductase subunit G|nr:RnfABCDGE type electron transport complex subunit G [Bacteroidales bacterium]HBZ21902.1 RnfABCDGE type electron transport complex subunit G [Bacteroidales bacterium]
MAKTESTFRNMALSLTLIALVSSALLGFVYELTKEPIALSNLNKKLNAIKLVVPEFNNNPNDEMFRLSTGEGDSLEVYPAKKDDVIVGYAVNTFTSKGFSGNISLMAGFRPDGTIINISVLEQKETPGLGTKMTEPGFKDQFNEKNPAEFQLKVKKDGGPVDAITAATISSRAFCDAVQRAYNTLQKGGIK